MYDRSDEINAEQTIREWAEERLGQALDERERLRRRMDDVPRFVGPPIFEADPVGTKYWWNENGGLTRRLPDGTLVE